MSKDSLVCQVSRREFTGRRRAVMRRASGKLLAVLHGRRIVSVIVPAAFLDEPLTLVVALLSLSDAPRATRCVETLRDAMRALKVGPQ